MLVRHMTYVIMFTPVIQKYITERAWIHTIHIHILIRMLDIAESEGGGGVRLHVNMCAHISTRCDPPPPLFPHMCI